MSGEKFEASPIIFGDFIKMGADPSDRLYEELADVKKIRNVLNEVVKCTLFFKNICMHDIVQVNVHVYIHS